MSGARPALWRGFEAVCVEGGGLRLTVVPALSGKIVSLVSGPRGEWLMLPGPAVGAGLHLWSAYVSSPVFGGWDECFPSIEAGAPGGDYPDHGQAWRGVYTAGLSAGGHSGGWDLSNCLLERTITVTPARRIRLDYRAVFPPSVPRPRPMWAAHPQFSARGLERVAAFCDGSGCGRAAGPCGGDLLTELRRTVATGSGGKLFGPSCRGDQGSGVELRAVGGETLTIEWRAPAVSHVGYWLDRGRYAAEEALSIQPSRIAAPGDGASSPGSASWAIELGLGDTLS